MTTEQSEQNSFLEDLFKEFGDPDPVPLWMKTAVKTFENGVRCNLNPECKKVNTVKCDPIRCQRSAIKRAKLTE